MSADLFRSFPALRAVTRLSALAWVALTAGAAFMFCPKHRRDLGARARWLECTCRRALRALRVTTTNRGASPAGGIVAANHLGYLDVLVLAAEAPTVFVAKREVAGWPVFGWFARAAGTRFIERKRRSDVSRVAADLESASVHDVRIVLFLEGTSSDGRSVLPFKSSLLEPAARNGWPVIPAAMAVEVPPGRSAADEVCWWGAMTLLPHLWNLATLPWIRACVAYGEPTHSLDRKQLALALRVSCSELLGSLSSVPWRHDASQLLPHEEQLAVTSGR